MEGRLSLRAVEGSNQGPGGYSPGGQGCGGGRGCAWSWSGLSCLKEPLNHSSVYSKRHSWGECPGDLWGRGNGYLCLQGIHSLKEEIGPGTGDESAVRERPQSIWISFLGCPIRLGAYPVESCFLIVLEAKVKVSAGLFPLKPRSWACRQPWPLLPMPTWDLPLWARLGLNFLF